MDTMTLAPFDTAFNRAVLAIAHHYVPTFLVSDDAPSTYPQLRKHMNAGKVLVVAKEGSHNTIFADPEANYAFRAWHDWCHWMGEYDFSLYGESATCCMQIEQLYSFLGVTAQTQKWSRYLIAEVIGQRQYYEKNRSYIADQRAFARAYMLDPPAALAKQW